MTLNSGEHNIILKKLDKKGKIAKLNSQIDLLIKYMGNGSNFHDDLRVISQLKIVHVHACFILPYLRNTLDTEYSIFMSKSSYHPTKQEINNYLEHIKDLMSLNIAGNEEIEEGKIFLGAKEKLEQARKSYRNEDAPGLFSSLHTVIELILKDKLRIALDMDGARLGKIIGICLRNKVFPSQQEILKSINSNVCEIDNNIKHRGYNPSARQINDALLVTEQIVRTLENVTPATTDEIMEEISEICIKNN